jgi:hypothetical protein
MNPEGYPQFVHDSADGVTICFSIKQALKLWKACTHPQQLLQKFIVPPNRVPTKLRIYWEATKGPKYYIIKSQSPLPKLKIIKTPTKDSLCSRYQHSISDFPFAGKILKSSFNCFMPEQSQIASAKRLPKSPHAFKPKQDLYMCKSNRYNTELLKEDNSIKEVKDMMDRLVGIINYSIGMHDKKVATELIIDFVQDHQENGIF